MPVAKNQQTGSYSGDAGACSPNPPYVHESGCLTPSGISGVVLFWKPPNLSTLSKTRGYRVNLYYYKLNATGSVQVISAHTVVKGDNCLFVDS
ncbi:hypothetical protein EB796_015517 [Bugula neritina]|uniref:Uncharacterized protein n=1 Tax=Bugula neritina TaxID=10212 RepID=A0A7J7JL75_BUGNE|nr:hypothetical protein EB796_015517 [Bugula neritina]